ncbi:hypothetical protein BD324DRAFT_617810 [Kockovaella imperatae]|uniref:GPI inositol-deacylase transmembrane domain-containing protein n=1 Tax=Kockovaella imperatae TaxID=4999 RepID=A0A1Y1ULG9_9TREE|nr:hypothetical protein BD324DRAFT_617810 [Kockovaella imperatae]ORX38893.1 hypothetical protein BD324DRAFT_617810 [Kockovaella imperatae]
MLLLTFILPFNLVTLGIWARTLWLDWRSAFSSDHNILRVIPLLGLVELSSRTQELHSRHLFIRVAQACLLLLSLIAFLFGGRHMYILPYLVDPVLLCLWGILWP